MERVRSAGLDPDVKMYDDLIELCVVAGKFGWAMKYINEMSAYGLDLDKVKYRKLFLELVEEQEGVRLRGARLQQRVASHYACMSRKASTRERKCCVSEVQSQKALPPIVVILEGSAVSASEVQRAKA